jgi:hypothetical protein
MAKKSELSLPSQKHINEHSILSPYLRSTYAEIRELSKKKPDLLLNKTKVKMINRILERAKAVYSNEPGNEFLDLLDEDSLPSNSDAVLVLSNHIAADKIFADSYFFYDTKRGKRRWRSKEDP